MSEWGWDHPAVMSQPRAAELFSKASGQPSSSARLKGLFLGAREVLNSTGGHDWGSERWGSAARCRQHFPEPSERSRDAGAAGSKSCGAAAVVSSACIGGCPREGGRPVTRGRPTL